MLVSYMQHHLQDLPKYFEVNIATKDSVKIFTYCIKEEIQQDGNGETKITSKTERAIRQQALNKSSNGCPGGN